MIIIQKNINLIYIDLCFGDDNYPENDCFLCEYLDCYDCPLGRNEDTKCHNVKENDPYSRYLRAFNDEDYDEVSNQASYIQEICRDWLEVNG